MKNIRAGVRISSGPASAAKKRRAGGTCKTLLSKCNSFVVVDIMIVSRWVRRVRIEMEDIVHA
jgi:hypothetical protein